MDAEIERFIEEELNKVDISEDDLDNYVEADLPLNLSEDDSDVETDMPESVLTYFEAARDRISVFERHIQENQETDDYVIWRGTPVTCQSEDLLMDLAASAGGDPIALKEKIISELEEQFACPTDLNHHVAVDDNATPQNESGVSESDEYLESEQSLQQQLEELERRLREEEEQKRETHEAERQQHLLTQKEEEERRRLRQKEFEKELKKIEEETRFQTPEDTERLREEKMELELISQQEVIRRLEEEMEEERRVFEKAQEEQRRRDLEKAHGAATKIQAAIRAFLTRRWARPALIQRREEKRRKEEQRRMEEERRERENRLRREREEEEKRREAEEAHQREEQERRRAEYEKAKQEERLRLECERRLEEERRRRREEEKDRRRKEAEEKKRREEEEDRKRKEEEKKRQEEEEDQKRKEAEKKRREEEEDRKRKEAEEKKRRDKEEVERKRNEEKEKLWKLEEEKRRQEEARQRQVEEQKRKEEEERKSREAKEQQRRQEEEKRKRVEGEKEEIKRIEEEKKKEEERKMNIAAETKNELIEGRRIPEKKTQDNKETWGTQSTQEAGKHRPDKELPVKQEAAVSSNDLRCDQTQASAAQHLHKTPPETSTGEQRELMGHQDRPADPQNGGSSEAVAAGSVCLPDATEQKRLGWMLSCIPWSKLSMMNQRKKNPGLQAKRRGQRRPQQPSLQPLSVDTVLQSGSWSSLSQVTTVTLEDLPGCSLCTLAGCSQLQSLTLRRCGLTTLEGLNPCTQLRFIDVQENCISYVDCGDLARLQVLRMGRNQLTSIHGLDGAVDLVELQLSHNRISRLGGLEALKKLQSLWVDHNQLTSTRGLTEAFTLLHLDLSHNHVTRAEGLDHCALLRTLRLAGNTLTEAPCLKNHVLLGELSLEDNSISCLEGLSSCWLPLLHSLNVSQNSLTQLPPLSDFISLMALDVSHNCLSELQSVCESVQQCSHLQELRLAGNPLQQETSWRSSLVAAVPGLLLLDGEQTGVSPATPPSHPPAGSFHALCQAQKQQLRCFQDTQHTQISSASSPLEAQLLSGLHGEALFLLAEEQRYAHEYGDTSVTHPEPAHTLPLEATSPMPCSPLHAGEVMPAAKQSVHIPSPPEQRQAQPGGDLCLYTPPTDPHSTDSSARRPSPPAARSGPDLGQARQRTSPHSPGLRHAKLDLRSLAAVVIQKHWWGYRCRRRKCPLESPVLRKCPLESPPVPHGKCSPSGEGKIGAALPKPPNRDQAATVIQAGWRGHALRSRLALALAAAATADNGLEDDDDEEGLEEVDVDEFVFDEEAMERGWIALRSDGVLPRRECAEASVPVSASVSVFSERPPLPKAVLPPAVHHSRKPVLLWKPKQAWSGSEAASPLEMSIPQGSCSRSKSPASTRSWDCISPRSEKILEEWGFKDSRTAYLMLKRAQRMKSRKQQQGKLRDPTVRLALFRNHAAQPVPAPVRGRAPPSCKDACEGAALAEEEQGVRQGRGRRSTRAFQWMHTLPVGLAPTSAPDPDSPSTCASERFLPAMSPDVLNGGRVQLVTIAGHRDVVCAGPADVTHREPGLERGHSVGHSRREAPSPQRVTSAPSRKERISFRDQPVQRSVGWGGGKKRARVRK